MVLLFQFSPADEENCRKEKLLSKIAVTGYSFWDRFIYTNLHELLCQFISWTNWVNSGKFMENCWRSCQVMADMKKDYDDLSVRFSTVFTL